MQLAFCDKCLNLILEISIAANSKQSLCQMHLQILITKRRLTLYSIDTHFDASTKDIVENIVEKEETARNEQFLLFPQCFLPNQILNTPTCPYF